METSTDIAKAPPRGERSPQPAAAVPDTVAMLARPVNHLLRVSTRVARPRDEVFAFFSDAANLGAVTPPALNFRIITPLPIEMREGALIDYTIGLYGIPLRWRTEITRWEPPFSFEDTQLRGPYSTWVHRHLFRHDGDGTIIDDEVRYALPFGVLGRLVHPIVRWQLRRIFRYRQDAVARLLA